MKGKDLFDSLVWTNPLSTSIFYTFIASLRKKIRQDIHHTTPTHRFIRSLRDGGRLVRCYTQNIDGLEARDGLCTDMNRGKGNRARFMKRVVEQPRPEEPILPGCDVDGGCEVVQLHGDLDDLRCGLCNRLCSWEEDGREERLLNGEGPECRACSEKDEARRDKGKRGTSVGILRPNIVLYGEEHPAAHLLSPMATHDIGLGPDVLLILGTSLRVHGLKLMVREFAKAVHARGRGKGKVIFVNRTKPPESVWSEVIDYWISMDCDAWVEDLRERRADLWEHQGTLKLPLTKDLSAEDAKPTQPGKSTKDEASQKTEKRSKAPPKRTKRTVASADKENIGAKTARVAKSKTSTMKLSKKVATGKKTAGAKTKQSLTTGSAKARMVRPRTKRDAAAERRLKVMPNDTGKQQTPTIPSKEAVSGDIEVAHQQLQSLPTRRETKEPTIRSTKRSIECIIGEDMLQASPSKRVKSLQVWVDDDATKDLTHAEADGSRKKDGGLQMDIWTPARWRAVEQSRGSPLAEMAQ